MVGAAAVGLTLVVVVVMVVATSQAQVVDQNFTLIPEYDDGDQNFTLIPDINEYEDGDHNFTLIPDIYEYEDGDQNFTLIPDIYEYEDGDHGRRLRREALGSEPLELGEELGARLRTPGGERLFQGDILLTEDQWAALTQRNAITNPNYFWPAGDDGIIVVPYLISASNPPPGNLMVIRNALDHWQTQTCIRFEETTNANQPHLIFMNGGSGACYSYVGKIYSNTGQPVSIGEGCDTLGIVAHEVGHALGLSHEQSGTDRDQYVKIHEDNIRSASLNNFELEATSSNYGVPYDYGSLMHYGSKYFTDNGAVTISTIDPFKNYLIGQRGGLSFRDVLLMNKLYNCTGLWEAACGGVTCLNDGYVGANCECVCPPNTSGPDCATVTGDYYGEPTDECTEVISSSGTVSSPGHPNLQPAGLQCMKKIEAPECHLPQLNFTAFHIYKRTTCSDGSLCCRYDSLEFRQDPLEPSTLYCDEEISPGTVFTGNSRTLWIYYYTLSSSNGWSAELTFIPDPACSNSSTPTTTNTSTTTTTTTSTTTSTTTTSPTTPPRPRCKIAAYNGTFYWTSPNFDIVTRPHYPNNFRCSLGGYSSTSMLTVRVVFFRLQPKVDGECLDYVQLDHLYGRSKTWCGRKRRSNFVFRTPSFNFGMTFQTDSAITRPGFNISLRGGPWPRVDCHEIIRLDNTTEYDVQSPDFMQRVYRPLYCEYRFLAAEGRNITVNLLSTKIRSPPGCSGNFLLMNGNKERLYPPASSLIFCDRSVRTDVMVTSTNQLSVAYQKQAFRTRGFRIKVQAV